LLDDRKTIDFQLFDVRILQYKTIPYF